MEGRVEVQEEGKEPRVLKREPPDRFADLATPGAIHSTVGFTVGSSQDFGKMKVVAYMTVTCDQREATINHAGELAFMKAVELFQDGFRILTGELPK